MWKLNPQWKKKQHVTCRKYNILLIYNKMYVCHIFVAYLIVQFTVCQFTCYVSWHILFLLKRPKNLVRAYGIQQTKQKCWVSEYFPVHLSGYIGKYKHWFYLANKIRATSYSTYVIPIIISVSCQWVCLYRKFLFRNTTHHSIE